METTYAERKLLPLGFKIVGIEESCFFTQKIIFSIGHLKFQFDCICPAYPNIKALGCPLHHEGKGGSWPIMEAIKIAALYIKI